MCQSKEWGHVKAVAQKCARIPKALHCSVPHGLGIVQGIQVGFHVIPVFPDVVGDVPNRTNHTIADHACTLMCARYCSAVTATPVQVDTAEHSHPREFHMRNNKPTRHNKSACVATHKSGESWLPFSSMTYCGVSVNFVAALCCSTFRL